MLASSALQHCISLPDGLLHSCQAWQWLGDGASVQLARAVVSGMPPRLATPRCGFDSWVGHGGASHILTCIVHYQALTEESASCRSAPCTSPTAACDTTRRLASGGVADSR